MKMWIAFAAILVACSAASVEDGARKEIQRIDLTQ